MDLSSTLDALEQHLEALTGVLQQAHDDLDGVEDTPPADEDVQALDDATEKLQQVTSQLSDTCQQWQQECAQLNEKLIDALSGLKQVLGDQQTHAEAEAASATQDFEEARTDIDRATVQLLDDAQQALGHAESALQAMLDDAQGQLSGLTDATHARFVESATADFGVAIGSLTQAFEQLESAGGDVARTAMTGLKTVTDSVDGIVDVLNGVKPAFEAISVIA